MKKFLLIIILAIIVTGCGKTNRTPKTIQKVEPTKVVEVTSNIEPTIQPTKIIVKEIESCYPKLKLEIARYLKEKESPDDVYATALTCEDSLEYHRIRLGIILKDDAVLEKYLKY